MSRRNDCGSFCLYRIMPFLEGFVIIVLGVFLFMTNYGFMDASIWKWLLPLVVMLVGFKWITSGPSVCDCCDDMIDECYDVNMTCCDDEDADECEGECACEKGEDKESNTCGCGNSCECGSKK